MKSKKLKQLALLGLSSGLLLNVSLMAATPVKGSTAATLKSSEDSDPNDGNLGYHLMTEDELLLELTGEGAKEYNSLTPEGKALARFVASQRCGKTNACKGLNACETETNKCAGQGKCKATSKCAISDKNLAVKIVAKKMAEKRTNLNNNKKDSDSSKSK